MKKYKLIRIEPPPFQYEPGPGFNRFIEWVRLTGWLGGMLAAYLILFTVIGAIIGAIFAIAR